ncbi:winged helix-turn-helix transcriptional regulator [Undibacterium sp. CY18W]|uniref:Winged helix-turn-helix transcriptional regulator n=1 Tax=Undibacterium hunanense TaxID=2762292 RepID=A0ABR6ZSW8_9BURK|nr:MarR family winged helix-turn-helix transcriptional regulator [Undibacterium hunanense]MBC3918615.1 winged helix-turn-helix transcriptional regulator [Undibacterium hunanense]
MDKTEFIYRMQSAYPRIYHACHADHQPAAASGIAISQRDATILAHLSSADAMTQSQLARHLGITKSTMSEAIKYLASLSLLEMQIATDKRAHLLRLTDKGKAMMGKSSVLETDKLAAVLAEMTATEMEQAIAGLELLAQACFRLTMKREDTE